MRFFDGEYFIRFAGGFGIRWYGFLIMMGILLAVLIVMREFKRREMNPDDVFDMIWIVLGGFVGARLYYVIWQWDSYADNPISALYVWQGGLAIYGGIIAGAIGLYIYSRVKKYRFVDLLDIAAPVLALAQGIGRWGNFFNKEAYGMPVTDPKWQFFPYAVEIPFAHRIPEYAEHAWFQATFFYESITCLAIFAVLFLYRKRQKFSGELVLWYFTLYGVERGIVEGFRTDSLMWGSIRVSQLLSWVLVVAAVSLLVVGYVKYYRSAKKAKMLYNDKESESQDDTLPAEGVQRDEG